jgi:hypothetical protein
MSNPEVSRSSIHLLFLAAVIAMTGFACGDKAPKHLGELVEVLGGTATKRNDSVSEWTPAKAGDRFKNHNELRTDENGDLRLLIGPSKLRMKEDTTLFFGKGRIQFYGEIEVDQGMEGLGIDFGDAEITTTGTLRITKREGSDYEFEVLAGEATIVQFGEITRILEGQELVLGDGEIEKIAIDAGVPDAAPPEADAAPEAPSAILAMISGKGVRIRDADAGGKWTQLKPGEQELPSNSDVDIKRRSKVVFTRGNDRVSIAGASMAYVNSQTAEFVTLKKGRADARAETAAVTVAVPGGTIQLHADEEIASNTHIEVGPQGNTADVKTGKTTLRTGEKSATIGIGESARMHKGQIEVIDKAPTFSHITLGTVASANLHVVRAPVNVRINFKEHCARAIVEVARGNNFKRATQRRAGKGNAIVVLPSGSHKYRVRCYAGDTLTAKAAATGRLSVKRDSGSRPLPRGAPKNTIDADGRRYTVLFQNRLPAIKMQWRKAPSASKYTLKIVPSKGKTKEVSGAKAERDFKPGTFTEGEYEYWFTANGKESKHSKLKISFDNAAATGYLSAPRPNAKLSGSETQVSGAAVLGWTVSVGGKALTLDKQYRFNEVVPLAPDGLAVRFSHPKYGVHYYIRGR